MATDPADAASTAWTPAICSPIYSSYRGRTRAALVQQCQTERRTLQFAERNLWNIAGERMAYSALMLAARITFVGFIGDELPERGADVIDIGSTPKPASRVFMRGACRRSRPASEAG